MTQLTLDTKIRILKDINLKEFLYSHHFEVKIIDENTMHVVRNTGFPTCLYSRNERLYFQIDLGSLEDISIRNKELYYKLLDLNTEIQPISVGIDSTNPENERLVLVENREFENLNDHELLSIFELFEHAIDKVEIVLSEYIKEDN